MTTTGDSDDDAGDRECLHCAIVELAAEMLDQGANPDELFDELVKGLAHFIAWNCIPKGRDEMLRRTYRLLPELVTDLRDEMETACSLH